MSNKLIHLLRVMVCLIPVLLVGCLGSEQTVDPVASIDEDGLADARSGLIEMAEMFKYFAKVNIKPPKKAAGFAEHDVLYPIAGVLLPKGKIVHFGGEYQASGEPKLLGYENGAGESGGWILLTNGEVKQVNAEEFAVLSGGSK